MLVLLAALTIPQAVRAQTSSLNTFSPYTMYGMGDLRMQGNAELRSMGGAGVAYRNHYVFNYLNPASLSSIPQNSAIFNFGAEGQNYYSKTAYSSTSKNNFNMHDLGLAIPLANRVGLGISLTPVSAVGYETYLFNNTQEIIENIGKSYYYYGGEGGVSQVTGSLGVEVVRGFSLGASIIYYFGSLDRHYNSSIQQMVSPNDYNEVKSFSKIQVSHLFYAVGGQYQIRVGRTNALNIGATFQPKGTINSKDYREQITGRAGMVDTIYIGKSPYPITIPAKIEAGLAYASEKFTAQIDYSYQNWKNAFEIRPYENITLGAQQQIRAGASYTPNRGNPMGNPLKRWTYRLGVRYGTSYLKYDNETLSDVALSFGFTIPFRWDKVSRITIGAELGQRGTTKGLQVRDRYINIFAGLSLFGEREDGWFYRRKFD